MCNGELGQHNSSDSIYEDMQATKGRNVCVRRVVPKLFTDCYDKPNSTFSEITSVLAKLHIF